MCDILIVEDEVEIAELLRDFLQAEGYSVTITHDGEDGLTYFQHHSVKLVILDIMLPGMDGFALCATIRETHHTPIFMISAKTAKEDQLNGLLLGADDYIEKPFDIDLLLAKINGIFTRHYQNQILKTKELTLDRARRIVTKGETRLVLSTKEFDLLELLMEHAGKAMSKELLFQRIWGFDSESEPQTLTVHIKWLREKIEKDPKHPVYIQTIWGVGYRFEG